MSSIEIPGTIGAMLRVPGQVIHRRMIADLNRSGFPDLRLPHIAVFSYPSPEGMRPGELAERSNMSKQAMNQLLQSLERLGYIERSAGEDDGRASVVHLTRRGKAAWDRILQIQQEIEEEWSAKLGAEAFAQLKKLLSDVWVSDLVP